MQSIAHLQLLVLGSLAAVSLLMMCKRKRRVKKPKEKVKTAIRGTSPAVVQKPKPLSVAPLPPSASQKPSKGPAQPDEPLEKSQESSERPPIPDVKPLMPLQKSEESTKQLASSTARPSQKTARNNSWDQVISPFNNSSEDDTPTEEDQPQDDKPKEDDDEEEDHAEEQPPTAEEVKEPEPAPAKPAEPTPAKPAETKTAVQARIKSVPLHVGPLEADQNRLYFPSSGGIQKLTIKNTSSAAVAIKVEPSEPDKYIVKPSCIFVDTGDTLELTIKRIEGGSISGTIDILFMPAPIDAEDPWSLFKSKPVKVKDRSNCMPIITSIELV